MNDRSASFLQHLPFGQRHPYDQDPEERFPRQPIAGEPVTLGVKTAPGSKSGRVWAVWQNTKEPSEHTVPGKWVSSSPDFELWQINLPAFDVGQTIRYQIFREGDGWRAQTDWFEFDVFAWEGFDRILSADEKEGLISVLFGGTRQEQCIQLTIRQQAEGTLDCRVHRSEGCEPSTPVKDPRHLRLNDLDVFVDPQTSTLVIRPESGKFELRSSSGIRALMDPENQIHRIELGFDAPADEAFYGFGERYNAIDQRGNTLRNRVIDQYKRQGKRTYYPVPFFISSRGYGVWVKTDHEVTFDLAETSSNTWKMEFKADPVSAELEFALMPQGSPARIIQDFTRLTGRAPMPPSWVFGLWMSSNDWNSQKEVLRQFDLTRQHNIPVTVLVIEAWADEVNFYIWNDAQYKLKPGGSAFKYSDFNFPAEGHWPDPKGMIDTLHGGGTRLILWQIPVLKRTFPEENLDTRQNELDEQYWIENRLCVMEANGKPYRVLSPWFRQSLLPDFTNPRTVDWWFKQREYLVKEMGVDGFKTDGSEHIWSDTVLFSDGSTGKGRCNSFVSLYLEAYDRFLETTRGKDRFLFSRAGYTGAQRHPGHWAGDEDSNWDAYRSNLTAMLNMSLSGEPFVGWDMAGFGNEPPGAELYLRSAAMAVFCPIMQFHSEYNARQIPSRDRTPWNIQERSGNTSVIPTFRRFVNVRMNLIPYIQSQAWRSTLTGLPMISPLQVEHPELRTTAEAQTEFLFGEALLVAPVMEEGSTARQVILPAGKWRDFWTQSPVEGGQPMTVEVPLDTIPVYQREGTIVALNLGADFELGSDVGNDTETYCNLELRIFPGSGCSLDLVRQQGARLDRVSVNCNEQAKETTIELPAVNCPLKVAVYTTRPSTVMLDGEAAAWNWSDEKQTVTVFVAAGPSTHTLVIHS
ncbi:MAG: TIM-barrel domain-containing protein [Anaerolineaceae bacterium]